ncbi:hypothetical protein ACHAPT_001485 [Fusarium lateritium]
MAGQLHPGVSSDGTRQMLHPHRGQRPEILVESDCETLTATGVAKYHPLLGTDNRTFDRDHEIQTESTLFNLSRFNEETTAKVSTVNPTTRKAGALEGSQTGSRFH